MTKVIVTKVQAELIEKVKKNNHYETVLRRVLNGEEIPNPNFRPLSELSFTDLMSAFINGYAIEQPKFEVGDWVVYEIDFGKTIITNITAIQYEHGRVQFEGVNSWKAIRDIKRHATKEEAFWAELGRDYREFTVGDVIILEGQLGFKIHDERQISAALAQWEKGKVTGFYNVESLKSFPISTSP